MIKTLYSRSQYRTKEIKFIRTETVINNPHF